ncbi:MAG: hypothetical protein IKP96_06680 [Elusimicrobiaceae bacterium]|nr:hypothetical protein [Elusimicrobiaceae bacterium]
MTVSMQLTKRIYEGNGLTREWDVDFPIASAEDLQIFITSPLGSEIQLETDFELNTTLDTLTYPTLASGKNPLEEGWHITLVRHTPLTQEIDLLRQGELDAEVLEQGYDKLTLLVQELSEKMDRCIKYPVSTQPASLDTDTFLNNILTAKQEATTASSQAVSSAQVAENSASLAQEVAQTAVSQITQVKETAESEMSSLAQSLNQILNQTAGQAASSAQTAQYYAEHTLGKLIGEIYLSQSSFAQDNPGALPLFTGETISNADQVYPEFYAWVADHTGLQISAADYETALTTYGECPKYVIDTTNKTIRLPKLVNYLKMANTTDGISQAGAGLPNITGDWNGYKVGFYSAGGVSASGALKMTQGSQAGSAANTQGSNIKLEIDASESSPVYGNSNTVTPAHTTLFPWVCAYNAAVPASTAQAAQFQAALSSKADTDLGNCTKPYVTETYVNGESWYRIWSDGWCEQGNSKVPSSTSWETILLLKQYKDTNYQVIATNNGNINGTSSWTTVVDCQVYTRDSIQLKGAGADANWLISWKTCGYIR